MVNVPVIVLFPAVKLVELPEQLPFKEPENVVAVISPVLLIVAVFVAPL